MTPEQGDRAPSDEVEAVAKALALENGDADSALGWREYRQAAKDAIAALDALRAARPSPAGTDLEFGASGSPRCEHSQPPCPECEDAAARLREGA